MRLILEIRLRFFHQEHFQRADIITHVPIPGVEPELLENFSDRDRNWARGMCMPLYLGTPGGVIKKLWWDEDAKRFEERSIGRI